MAQYSRKIGLPELSRRELLDILMPVRELFSVHTLKQNKTEDKHKKIIVTNQ